MKYLKVENLNSILKQLGISQLTDEQVSKLATARCKREVKVEEVTVVNHPGIYLKNAKGRLFYFGTPTTGKGLYISPKKLARCQ